MVRDRCWNVAGMVLVLEWWWLEVADRYGSGGAEAAYTIEGREATAEQGCVPGEADS